MSRPPKNYDIHPNPMNQLKQQKQVGKCSKIQNLDVSSYHNTDVGMRNPIFKSKTSNFGVQG